MSSEKTAPTFCQALSEYKVFRILLFHVELTVASGNAHLFENLPFAITLEIFMKRENLFLI